MPRYTWRLVFAMAEKIAKARKEGKLYISETVTLRDYEDGMSPKVSGTKSALTTYKLERHELDKALEIANYRSSNPVKEKLPPMPSPVGGATSAPSGGNDEGFGVEGVIVTCGSVPSTGCPEVGEAVLVTVKD